MSAITVERYKHHRGVHCATTALRNVYAYHTGIMLSEGMVFGLGAGLNFTYAQFPGSKVWLTMGRGSYLEANFCEVLGITLRTHVFRDEAPALEVVRQLITQQQPVIADSDMFLLPYMKMALNLPDRVNFGGHKIVVTGYDDIRGVASLYDYAWSGPQEISYAVLASARTSPGCPSSPMSRIYLMDVPRQREEISKAVWLAIAKAVNLMEHPPMHYLGMPALDRFCRQLPNWPRLLGDDAELNVRLASFMMESAGTGGGNYRKLYARFLSEAALLCGAPSLEKTAALYRKASCLWIEISGALAMSLESSNGARHRSMGNCQTLLNEIWKVEQRGLACLKEECA